MHVCSFDLLNFTNVGEKRVFAWSYHWIKSVDFMKPGGLCNLSSFTVLILVCYIINIMLVRYIIILILVYCYEQLLITLLLRDRLL